ncbi:large ribosomal subunit protein mL38-like [Saccostrea echinata]|uniref:large ribosomal subunit protein mL38-like n=1 Tax=Saccostrea echinata TaxID=191078 RepID=UPI002A818B7B|nr:large ribosomal subunit protein mL38-like [Saccostrea echinata]
MAASMANGMKNSFIKSLLNSEGSHRLTNVRYATGLRLRRSGKLPGVARTFEQRLEDMKLTKQAKPPNVNIGFPLTKNSLIEEQTKAVIKKKRRQLLAIVQDGKLKIDLDKVDEESWNTNKQEQLHRLTEHYGIFRDLFGGAYFYPHVNLDVSYDIPDDYELPVYHGNRIEPSQTGRPPNVYYEAEPDTLWTLLMTAPDSHLQDNNTEYLHWLVGNIPGNEISKGEVLCDYLQVFPVKGTGFHRCVFVLFKQEQKIDYSSDRLNPNTCSLRERSFKTFDFYEKHQDHITPAGISFFQCQHDESVRDVFWNKLGMKEPCFEFVFPASYHPKQKKFPHKQPFDLYLDRYRDIKDIDEEVLREKLKSVHPFKPPTPPPKYPFLHYNDEVRGKPSWIKMKRKHMLLKNMQWRES